MQVAKLVTGLVVVEQVRLVEINNIKMKLLYHFKMLLDFLINYEQEKIKNFIMKIVTINK